MGQEFWRCPFLSNHKGGEKKKIGPPWSLQVPLETPLEKANKFGAQLNIGWGFKYPITGSEIQLSWGVSNLTLCFALLSPRGSLKGELKERK